MCVRFEISAATDSISGSVYSYARKWEQEADAHPKGNLERVEMPFSPMNQHYYITLGRAKVKTKTGQKRRRIMAAESGSACLITTRLSRESTHDQKFRQKKRFPARELLKT